MIYCRKSFAGFLRSFAVLLAFQGGMYGLVHAQDMDSVKRRLGEAVEAGELSRDEAEVMLKALGRARESSAKESIERRLLEVKAELKAAVAAGEISAEDAEKKLNGLRRELGAKVERPEKKMVDKEAIERRLAEVKADLKAAVAAGKISAEDAERKLNGLRRELGAAAERPEKKMVDKEAIERRLADVKADLKAAVAAGEISAEAAERKLNALRREMTGGPSPAEKE